MLVELWTIERIKPYERNPRQNDGAADAVAASIKEFGFRQPIVVDQDGVIVVGHTRWKAAQKLGLAARGDGARDPKKDTAYFAKESL
jgi:ParB-like chromosome segregation protein Spo0J